MLWCLLSQLQPVSESAVIPPLVVTYFSSTDNLKLTFDLSEGSIDPTTRVNLYVWDRKLQKQETVYLGKYKKECSTMESDKEFCYEFPLKTSLNGDIQLEFEVLSRNPIHVQNCSLQFTGASGENRIRDLCVIHVGSGAVGHQSLQFCPDN